MSGDVTKGGYAGISERHAERQRLTYNPDQLDRIYTVTLGHGVAGVEPEPVQYNISVKYLEPLPGGFLLELDRSSARIGNAAAEERRMYELAQQCGNALYPLQLAITKTGRIADIYNHQQLLDRWEKTARYLRRYHVSDIALDYISQTERTLHNKEQLLGTLSRDLFLSVYFAPLYANDLDGIYPQRIDYPLIAFRKPVVFHVKQVLETGALPAHHRIKQTGTAALPQEPADVFPGLPQDAVALQGSNMEALYELDGTWSHIRSMEGRWTTDTGAAPRELELRIACISDNNASSTPQKLQS